MIHRLLNNLMIRFAYLFLMSFQRLLGGKHFQAQVALLRLSLFTLMREVVMALHGF